MKLNGCLLWPSGAFSGTVCGRHCPGSDRRPKNHLMAVIFPWCSSPIIIFFWTDDTGLKTSDPPEPLDGPDGEPKQEEDLG